MPEDLAPVRAITRGPRFHWFGYYDKPEFDPTGRYVLGMEVDFEHRSPTAGDTIKIGMVDLADGARWIELGEGRAWCWQQGCMLQWLPGSQTEIIWNDLASDGSHYVCHLLDVHTRRKRTLPFAIYTVARDGRTAVAPDFRRIQHTRPGYGYPGPADPFKDDPAPTNEGIRRLDLKTGEKRLIITLADVAAIPDPYDDFAGATHWFNHLLFNPAGTRFIFLHRWRRAGERGFGTRLMTAAPDGSDIRVVDDWGYASHFIWRDDERILVWAANRERDAAFYLFEDRDTRADEARGAQRRFETVGKGVLTRNGHCSYLPGGEWILNDTYAAKQNREQEVYLYHVATGRKVTLGLFPSPAEYVEEWRCDTHPRFSPNGRAVVIDSPHGGEGRQLHLIDVSGVVG